MGAQPKYAFLSLALPKQTEVQWIDSFFSGLGDLADRFKVQLLGGDTTSSKSTIAINITLLGVSKSNYLKYRHSAQVNDIICVTGNLGDSAAGLRCILEQINSFDSDVEFLMQRHNRPQVYTYEAQWLAEKSSVHAMIDISDGVASDIRHILKKSNCGCTINLEKLPMSDALVRISKKFNWNSLALAVGGRSITLLLDVESSFIQTRLDSNLIHQVQRDCAEQLRLQF